MTVQARMTLIVMCCLFVVFGGCRIPTLDTAPQTDAGKAPGTDSDKNKPNIVPPPPPPPPPDQNRKRKHDDEQTDKAAEKQPDKSGEKQPDKPSGIIVPPSIKIVPEPNPLLVIEDPVVQPIKLATQFTPHERAVDDEWFGKKKELASIMVTDRRRKKAAEIAQQMNAQSDEDFAFLTAQTYIWSDLFGIEPEQFAKFLSPAKLRIAIDAIANRKLGSVVINLPAIIKVFVSKVDVDDPERFEKLEAAIPAASASAEIGDEVRKKARAIRQKLTKNTEDWHKADLLVQRAIAADAKRRERILATPILTRMEPEIVEPPAKKPKWQVDSPRPAPELPKAQAVDWTSIAPKFGTWLSNADFDLANQKIDDVKLFIRYALKMWASASPERQDEIRNAIVKSLEQHNVTRKLFDLLDDVTDENEIATFAQVLPSTLMDELWNSEKELIIAGGSVRERQEKRLTALYKHLNDDQFVRSLANSNFWILLSDQPQASADGLTAAQFDILAKFFTDNRARPPERASDFAQKVVIKIDPEKDVDHAYKALVALAPVARFNTNMEAAINRKVNVLLQQLIKTHGRQIAEERKGALIALMK